MLTTNYIELEEEYGAHNYDPLDVVLERGEGVWVSDTEGKSYLDCLSRLLCTELGPLPS
jgi:ornithine--oxo-acid transaminase